MNVKILVATQSGNADLCAQEMVDRLSEKGHDAEALMMGDFGLEIFEGGGQFIICSSTYGDGEIPDNGAEFYEKLISEKPDLSDVGFAVYGLGDMCYEETFNFGGMKFDAAMAECGAERIVERHMHDADTGSFAEEEAVAWIDSWIAAQEARAAA